MAFLSVCRSTFQKFIGVALILAATGLALVSCSTPSLRDERKVIETGKASWYGKRFQGQKTASGEIFDAGLLTAAHPSLPFGTFIEVRSVASGKSVIVKVNDRGGANGRIIDLSQEAANRLGIIQKGEDRVELLMAR